MREAIIEALNRVMNRVMNRAMTWAMTWAMSGAISGALNEARKRLTALAAIVVAGIMLSACAGTDVELKGGVFDLMGISGNSGARREEPKMANRAGLVIPPTTASLPAPGAPPEPGATGVAFPVNPEDARQAERANNVVQHKAFCEKARQRQAAGITPMLESSPWGSCDESVLRNFTGRDLSGKKAVGTQ